MIDHVLNRNLLEIAALVNCLFSESWSNHIELAEVPPAVAVLTAASFFVMMQEIVIGEMLRSLHEEVFFLLALFAVLLQVMSMGGLIEWRIVNGTLGQHFVPDFVFYLEIWTLS
jgi:hypothetical protein